MNFPYQTTEYENEISIHSVVMSHKAGYVTHHTYFSRSRFFSQKICTVGPKYSFIVKHIYTPRKLCLWVGILVSRCPSFRRCVCVSVTFCYAPNFEKVGGILVSACPYVCTYVCMYVCMYVFMFEISS